VEVPVRFWNGDCGGEIPTIAATVGGGGATPDGEKWVHPKKL